MALQDVIAKIQKLRSLATSSNLNEAQNAAKIADKLIEEYRLSEAQISIENNSDDEIEEDPNFIYESGKITQWKSQLVVMLARHYGCGIFNACITLNGRQFSRYQLAGRKTDISIVNYMFTYICTEIARLSMSEAKGMGRVFVASYCLGAVAGIRHQLASNKEEMKKTANSTAMIRLDSRAMEAQQFINSQHRLTSGKNTSSQRVDSNAFAAGKTQGMNMHLGKAMGGATPSNRLLGR
jgi:hypothetical protein